MWSSFRHYATGVEGIVEIESQWTATETGTDGNAVAREEYRTIPPKQKQLGWGTLRIMDWATRLRFTLCCFKSATPSSRIGVGQPPKGREIE